MVVFDSPIGQIDDLAGGIHGTAEDGDSGVATVKIRLVRNWTGSNEWWNGVNAWVTGPTDLPNTALGTPNGTGKLSWDTTATMPAGTQLLPGRYTLQAIVADAAGNSTTSNNVVGIKPTDALKPATTITFPPADGINYSHLTEFRGFTIDPANGSVPGSGVTQVGVRLRRQKTGQTAQYWNGTAWVTSATQLPSMTELSWLRNTNLPSGSNLPAYDSNLSAADNWQYSILAYGIDRFNNIETPVVRTFNIVQNTLPRPDAQSLNVPRNIARAITLSATDDEHDQITYRIVTPPAHGTLSGTEPNLSYLSESNYIGPDSFTFVVKDWTNVESNPVTVTLNVVNDTTNPTAAISHPGVNERIDGSMTVFDGTANDAGTGIASVGMQIFRDWNGTSYYWGPTNNPNIWGWLTTPTTIDAALGTAQTNGDRSFSWPSSKPLPSTDWPTGRYSARVFPKDYANRTATYTNAFYRGQDATVPTGSIVPLNPGDAIPNLLDENGNSIFHGTASDSGGPAGENTLAKLQFRFLRNWTGANEYWNGSQWVATAADLPLTTTGPDGVGVTSWQSVAKANNVDVLPSGDNNLPSGRYSAQIIITDTSANVTTITSTILIIPLDTTAPSATVTFPANNMVLSRITEFRGTATDIIAGVPGSGVSRVLVRFKRQLKTGGTIEYWNGTTWTTSGVNLSPISETSWVRDTNLPTLAQLATTPKTPQDYNYAVMASAQDRYNNIGSFATNNFTVEPNTLPQASPQSVSTTGHYRRPGDTRSITLAASDAQNDTIIGWTIVDPPLHGTLIGTAPNLTYTPNADYFGPDSFTFTASDWGGAGEAATVDIDVTTPAPVDVLIKHSSQSEYTGDDIISTDGTNQTVTHAVASGSKTIYLIKAQTEAEASSLTLKVAGTAQTEGWTVKYYDALTNGLDVTAAVTGEGGWHPTLPGDEMSFRVEITAPEGLTEDQSLTLLVSAEREDVADSLDAVKVVTLGQPSKQPDVYVQGQPAYLEFDPYNAPNEPPPALPVIGQEVYSSDPADQKCVLPSTGGTRSYMVSIRNAGSKTATYRVSASIEQNGWKARYYEISSQERTNAVAAGTYELTLSPGQTHLLRAEVSTEVDTAPDEAALALTVREGATNGGQWQPGTAVDAAQLAVQAQSLAGIEYTLDGTTWQTFAGQLTVPRLTIIGFRGVKAVPDVPWRSRPMVQPVWSHGDEAPAGETVWLQYKKVGTQAVSGHCRTTIGGTITVVERE